MRSTYEYWKVLRQFQQRWETKVFQLQHIWTLSKGMQKAKEEQRNKKMLQIQQSRIPGKRLQVRAKDESQEKLRR